MHCSAGDIFTYITLSPAALPQCISQVWNHHLIPLAPLLQINKNRREGRLRRETIVLCGKGNNNYNSQANNESVPQDILCLMQQQEKAADCGQLQHGAWSVTNVRPTSQKSLTTLWPKKKINVAWPVDLSVKMEMPWQLCELKASENVLVRGEVEWFISSGVHWRLNSSPPLAVSPSVGFPPPTLHKCCSIFRQSAYFENCCGGWGSFLTTFSVTYRQCLDFRI